MDGHLEGPAMVTGAVESGAGGAGREGEAEGSQADEQEGYGDWAHG